MGTGAGFPSMHRTAPHLALQGPGESAETGTTRCGKRAGRIVSDVLWESEQALRESEEQTAALRQQGGRAAGASAAPAVDRYEGVAEAGVAGGGEDGDGQVARYTTGQAASERVEDLARHVR